MSIVKNIHQAVINSLTALYNHPFTEKDFQVNLTKPEFEGDYTVVMFSLVKSLKLSPDAIGTALGGHLVSNNPEFFTHYNIIKGFLNLSVADQYWINLLQKNHKEICYGKKAMNGKKVMVEYASPNTNKPLHLGHLRNIFLGWSTSEILKANGYEVIKSAIVNDRGIHICKSMIAWTKYANAATPESTGIKGDHLVGDYYVRFENDLKAEAEPVMEKIYAGDLGGFNANDTEKLSKLLGVLQTIDKSKEAEKLGKIKDDIKEIARANTPIMAEAKQMLLDWEDGKPEVMDLWRRMNGWVYEGFDVTYNRIGADFDKTYYESNTYQIGRAHV